MRAFAYLLGLIAAYAIWQLFYTALPAYIVDRTLNNYLICTAWLGGTFLALQMARATYKRGLPHEN